MSRDIHKSTVHRHRFYTPGLNNFQLLLFPNLSLYMSTCSTVEKQKFPKDMVHHYAGRVYWKTDGLTDTCRQQDTKCIMSLATLVVGAVPVLSLADMCMSHDWVYQVPHVCYSRRYFVWAFFSPKNHRFLNKWILKLLTFVFMETRFLHL